MPHAPKVSIILTSYNHAPFLRESIDSVLGQTFSDFEAIIWDDASTDDSWNIIRSYSDPRIRAFRNPENTHGGNIRRAITELNPAGLIAIQHSDDVWEPEKLEKQVHFLDSNPSIGAVFSHALIIDEAGEALRDQSHFYFSVFDQPNRTRFEWLNYFFLHGNALCHPSMLIRRKCYDDCGSYRYGMAQIPDFDMWVRLCLKYDIHVLPEKLVCFRIRSGEANASGGRLDTHTRIPFEFLQVMQNYRSISTREELTAVFPEAAKYWGPQGGDVGYALAMIALETKPFQATELFGLSILFEALNDPPWAARLKGLYGFASRDLIELSARHDIFGADRVTRAEVEAYVIQKEQVAKARAEEMEKALAREIRDRDLALQAVSGEMAEIRGSTTWQLAKALLRTRARLAPPGSSRDWAATKLIGGLKALGRQPLRRGQGAVPPTNPPAQPLQFKIESEIPPSVVAGQGNLLFVSGWCFHPAAELRRLSFRVGETLHPIPNFGFARRDVWKRLHVSRSLRSGFWGLLPILPVAASQDVPIGLVADLAGQPQVVVDLGTVQVLPSPQEDRISLGDTQGDVPLVALCMPTHNPPLDQFRRQIASLKAQTHTRWICVVQDDDSDYETYEQMLGDLAQDERFFLDRNERRLGATRATEIALTRLPQAVDFVALCEQNGYWRPELLAEGLKALRAEADQLVYPAAYLEQQNGTAREGRSPQRASDKYGSLETLMFSGEVEHNVALFRSGLLPEILPFPVKLGDSRPGYWVALVALAKGRIRLLENGLQAALHSAVNSTEARSAAHPLMPEISRLPRWLRSRTTFVHEAGTILLSLEASYLDYLTNLILFAKTLELRIGGLSRAKRASLRSIASAETGIAGLTGQALRYALSGRPTSGNEYLALRSYLAHRALDLYARWEGRRRQRDLQAPAAAILGGGPAVDRGADTMEDSVTLLRMGTAPVPLAPSEHEPPRVNVFMATINFKYVFGGYVAMFNLALRIAQTGRRVRIVLVEPTDYNPEEWKKQIQGYPGLEQLFELVETSYNYDRSVPLAVNPRDIFVATSCWTAHIASRSARQLDNRKIIFLAQEYEPLFFNVGSFQAISRASYSVPQFTIFSTELLREFFEINRIGVYSGDRGYGDQHSLVFNNAINSFRVSLRGLQARAKKKLLFYARPEQHASRNLFELGILGLSEAVRAGYLDSEAWEFYGIGTAGGARRIRLDRDVFLSLLPKVNLKEYTEILPSFDLGLSLMLSPHPSLVPLEMAAAGMITVTNTCENKTAAKLAAISRNLIGIPPTADGIADGLRQAAGRAQDYAARLEGAKVDWPTDWSQAFNPEFMRTLVRFMELANWADDLVPVSTRAASNGGNQS